MLKKWFKKKEGGTPSFILPEIKTVSKKLLKLEEVKTAFSLISTLAKYGSLLIAIVKAVQAIKEEMEKEMKKDETPAEAEKQV